TSMVRLSGWPEMPGLLSLSAVKTSGSDPEGNSTSTTGPRTWVTLPMLCTVAIQLASSFQRFRAGDDFHQLLGDHRLPRSVVEKRQPVDHLRRIRCGLLHRAHPGAVLARNAFEEGSIKPDDHRLRSELPEDAGHVRLVLEINRRGSGRRRGGPQRKKLDHGDALADRRDELVVEEQYPVHLTGGEVGGEFAGDVRRRSIVHARVQPGKVLANGDFSSPKKVMTFAPDG